MINEAIKKLVCYGLENSLIAQEDVKIGRASCRERVYRLV